MDADFWARFGATKYPGEHMHTLTDGSRVYCTKREPECSAHWDIAPTDAVGKWTLPEVRAAMDRTDG